MMPKTSAGLLCYRRTGEEVEVFLVHPGGPYWTGKDLRGWSIPKGLAEEGEAHLDAAKREFCEETGFSVDSAALLVPLDPVRQGNGKLVYAWAFEGDYDASRVQSNLFTREWPPGSGRQQEFPEVDRAGWFPLSEARRKIHAGQEGLLIQLEQWLKRNTNQSPPP